MDLSSASDQPSGVRRRLSSRKAAQLRSLFCSCTPTARLETESDDAVLMHRKISRSEGRIAAVHPPAPRRERKKSVIIIPLPAACIVSSSIIFFLLSPLFLASVSEGGAGPRQRAKNESQRSQAQYSSRRNNPQELTEQLINPGDGRPKLYFFAVLNYWVTFEKFRLLYDPDLDVRTVRLIEGYKKDTKSMKHLQILAQRAGVGKGNLKKTINYAVKKARESPGTAVKVELEKLGQNIREVRAIAPSGEGAIGNAILILWEPPETNTTFNRHHLGVVLVSGKPKGWEKMEEAKKQIAVKGLAHNAFSLLIEHNKEHPKKEEKEQDESIRVFATHPIFGMPLETIKGYNETNSYLDTAPVVDFLDEKLGFFPALGKYCEEYNQRLVLEFKGPDKESVLGVRS